jgi:hypothetical protein
MDLDRDSDKDRDTDRNKDTVLTEVLKISTVT